MFMTVSCQSYAHPFSLFIPRFTAVRRIQAYPDLMEDQCLDMIIQYSPEVLTCLLPFPFLFTNETLLGKIRFTWLRGSDK